MINTAEAVSNYHPDKICDIVADFVLHSYLSKDPNSRVAVEVLGGHGEITIMGEVTSKARIALKWRVKRFLRNSGVDIKKIRIKLVKQSPQISKGVDKGGAGDQGIMIGYACNENSKFLPQEMYLAKEIVGLFSHTYCKDAKCQVTIENGKVTHIVLSALNETKEHLKEVVDFMVRKDKIKLAKGCKLHLNPAGEWTIGGFDADCGTVGRKIVNDQYGTRVPVGGGAFSGKDPSKVDRSGAYMARFIALDLLKKYKAKEVLVKLAYVIGEVQPVMKVAVIDGKERKIRYDCRPNTIIKKFHLKHLNYVALSLLGHFGNSNLPWEKV